MQPHEKNRPARLNARPKAVHQRNWLFSLVDSHIRTLPNSGNQENKNPPDIPEIFGEFRGSPPPSANFDGRPLYHKRCAQRRRRAAVVFS